MPPRVTYWTGTWDPAKEAISKEIESLRCGPRSGAPVVSFSRGQRTRWIRGERALLLSSRAWMALRGLAALIEPLGDVSHVFGGQSSWHLLRALGRRPILLTAVMRGVGVTDMPTSGVGVVAVESEAAIDEWTELGIPRERIEVVRPGIDVDRFAHVGPPQSNRFTLLFASSPSDPDEIGPRGIALLVDLARLRPEIDILIPWRSWGNVAAARLALEKMRPPPNFIVEYGDQPDMRRYYARAHATIVCFAHGAGKTSPHFVLEGLAAGRPAVSTPENGLAADLDRSGAGVVCPRSADSLANAVDVLRTGWATYAAAARAVATTEYSLPRFRKRYEELYERLAGSRR